MKRFPILRAYHAWLQFMAFLLMIAGLIVALMASQNASNLYMQASVEYNSLQDLVLKVAVFAVVYALAMLVACIPLVMAEGLLLRLSMEEHLYDLRHREVVPVYVTLPAENSIQRKVTQQMAAVLPAWRTNGENGHSKPVTELNRPPRRRTGTLSRPPTGPLAKTGPLKREVLPGKPKTAPLRPPELMPRPLADEETRPVEDIQEQEPPQILPATTIKTQEMVALSKQSKTLRDPTASYNFRKAVEQFEAENFPVAIQYLDKALAVDPGYANAYRLRAACYRRTGDAEHARQDLSLYMRYVAEQIPQE